MAVYVRGAGGVELDARRVVRVVAGVGAIAIVCLIVVLTVAAVGRMDRARRLRNAGVPVRVRVVSCVGVASGTGITASGYTCRGSYTLDGRHYVAVIGGLTRLRRPDQLVLAVADPSAPAVVATSRSVARAGAVWASLVAPGALLTFTLAVGGVVLWRSRRARRPVNPSDIE